MLYAAAIDMAQWAETKNCAGAILSQHHAVEDGYLPSPVPLAAAMAAWTRTIPINVAALLLALDEPVKLAEDLAVVDLISRGRVSYVVGIGYRDEEFAMFGVVRRGRGGVVEERIRLLQHLWSGEPQVLDGRTVRVTPLPFTPGGPFIAYGGGTEAAARRAARLGLMFMAETHDASLEQAYRDEGAAAVPGCFFPPEGVPLTVFVAEDPERAWAEIGRYLLADAVSYSGWNATRHVTASISRRHLRRRTGRRGGRLPDPDAGRGGCARPAHRIPAQPPAPRGRPAAGPGLALSRSGRGCRHTGP